MFYTDSVSKHTVGSDVSHNRMSVTRKQADNANQEHESSERDFGSEQRRIEQLLVRALKVATGLETRIELTKDSSADFQARIPARSTLPIRIVRDDGSDVVASLVVVIETLETPLQVIPDPTTEIVFVVEDLRSIGLASHGFSAQVASTDLVFRGWAMLKIPSAGKPTDEHSDADSSISTLGPDVVRLTDTSALAHLFVSEQDCEATSLFAIANNLDRQL